MAVWQIGIWRIVRTCHSDKVAHTGVGISIEFQVVYRHTVCYNLPFPCVYPREVVLLFGRLPRQCELLYRNDREVGTPPPPHGTIPSGSGKERPQTTFVTTWLSALPTNSNLSNCRVKRAEICFIPDSDYTYSRYRNNEQIININFVCYSESENLMKNLTFLVLTCLNKYDINIPEQLVQTS